MCIRDREQAEYNKFLAENEELTSLQKFAGKISGLTNPLTFIIINFAILVLIHTGAVRVSLGTLSQGQVVALYNYMSQILVELIKLANLIISVTKAMACFNRIQDVFHIEPVSYTHLDVYKRQACTVQKIFTYCYCRRESVNRRIWADGFCFSP